MPVFEPVEPALNDVATLVDVRIEGVGAASCGAAPAPVGKLVVAFWDGCLDGSSDISGVMG